jgi:rRNA maturation protein Nop10
VKAVAIRKGQSRQTATGLKEMGTLRCDACGEEFSIGHPPPFLDLAVAEKQVRWLEKVLAEEHDRGVKHADRIELPA